MSSLISYLIIFMLQNICIFWYSVTIVLVLATFWMSQRRIIVRHRVLHTPTDVITHLGVPMCVSVSSSLLIRTSVFYFILFFQSSLLVRDELKSFIRDRANINSVLHVQTSVSGALLSLRDRVWQDKSWLAHNYFVFGFVVCYEKLKTNVTLSFLQIKKRVLEHEAKTKSV